MSEKKKTAKPRGEAEPETVDAKRKPYEKPAWEVEEAETEAAMSCAKADSTVCAAGPIQS